MAWSQLTNQNVDTVTPGATNFQVCVSTQRYNQGHNETVAYIGPTVKRDIG